MTDSECVSGFCFHGGCAPEGTVLYVRPDGMDGANACTSATAPCRTVAQALSLVPSAGGSPTNRRYIKLVAAGLYAESVSLAIDDKHAVVRGPAGEAEAVIAPADNVRIANNSNVTLEHLTLQRQNAGGIICSNSVLTVDGVRVVDSSTTGIRAEPCELTVRASVIAHNAGGGVYAEAQRVVLVNNVIVDNGGILSSFGGIRVSGLLQGSVVQSNTLVGNRAATGQVDGIDCNAVSLQLRNNIVFGASGRSRVGGNCAHDHTLYGPDDPDGRLGTTNGNRAIPDDAAFRFVATARDDYHIGAGSVANGAGTTTGLAAEALTDLDGEARPRGACDVGADEVGD